MTELTRIPKRIASTLINSLKGGVVPRVGLPYITVGRKNEIDALLHDVELVMDGGASFRFIMGRYGSGKSFMLQTIRNVCMDKGFVVMDADLSPERRLTGTRGQGLATYSELVANLATKTKPEGGALSLVLDRWAAGGERDLTHLSEMVHGYEFGKALNAYAAASAEGDDEMKARLLRWFRGEYPTKTEAKRDLGINVIITDDDWYDYLKVFAAFLTGAGYCGMLILVDELVNIYKIPNSVTRQANYEKLLTMYNDALSGKARYLGIIMCGTPQCIEDNRRGIYSYEALRSRLDQGRFSGTYRDMLSPVIRLESLNAEEMLVLVEKLTAIHAVLYGYEPTLDTEALADFIKTEFARIGADSLITPREVIRDFIEVLDILCQNPGLSVGGLLGSDTFTFAKNEILSEETDPQFAEFRLT